MNFIRKLTSYFTPYCQQELKRFRYHYQIKRDTFRSEEPEFDILEQFISEGDWVIDVGANIGHYTKRFSDLVGAEGRVIAIEPVPFTFALLASNVSLFNWGNVTLLNVAASKRTTVLGMAIPDFERRLKNYYQASIVDSESHLQVMAINFDSLKISHRVSLIKIDAEGHDPIVLQGMLDLLKRDHPTLIIETTSPQVFQILAELGYKREKLAGSPNTIFR